MIRFVPISEECEVAQDIDWKIIDPRKEIDRTLSGDIGLLEFKESLRLIYLVRSKCLMMAII